MTFLNPWALWIVPAAAAAAAVRLLRPRRRVVRISNVDLWRAAAAETGLRRRRRPQVSVRWCALTAGTLAAALAMAAPAWDRRPSAPAPVEAPPAAVIIDAAAAERLADGTSELFVAVRNDAAAPRATALTVVVDGAEAFSQPLELAPGERRGVVVPIAADAARVRVDGGEKSGRPVDLIAVEAAAPAVALLGRENPFIRRFLHAGGCLEAAAVEQADVVIAVGVDPPAGLPGIVFNPPTPPPGWRRAVDAVGPVDLASADRLADSPLLRHVAFQDVAVRRLIPWRADPGAAGERLVTIPGGAILVATDLPRRLYVAIDPAGENTGWGLDESFPILLDAALTWTAPSRQAAAWKAVSPDAGALRAASPGEAAPERLEFWPCLAAAAGLLWLCGWARRPAADKTMLA